MPLLRPVVVRIVALDGRDDLGASDPEIKADRYGGRDVAAVVVSDQTRADGQTVPSRFDEGFCSDRLGRRVGNSPQSGARFDHRFQTVAVVQPKGGPSACNQEVEQLALAPHHALDAPEAFQMRLAYVRNQPVIGPGDRAEQRDLAGVARSHLDDAYLDRAVHGEQRQRHADMVVQIALRDGRAELAREYPTDELFGRGLAVAARDGEDRNAELAAMPGGQFLQGGQRVGDLRATVRPLLPEGFRYGRVVHDGCRSPGFQRVFRIAVTVETLAVQGEKQRIRDDVPAVGRNPGMPAEKFV